VHAFGGSKCCREFFYLLIVLQLRNAQAVGANRNHLWMSRHSATHRSNKVATVLINNEVGGLKARGMCLTQILWIVGEVGSAEALHHRKSFLNRCPESGRLQERGEHD
jgi:hypothetical protein